MEKNYELTVIPIQSVETNPLDDWPVGDIDDLAASISQLGVIDSCAVIGPYPNGNYRLLSGKRRRAASIKVGKEELPCHIVDGCDMPDNMQKLYIESANLDRRDMPSVTKNEHRAYVMNILVEMVRNGELKERKMARKIAELLKVSPRYGRYWRAIYMDGVKDLQDMVASSEIDPKPAAKISTFPEEKQNQAVEQIKSGISVKSVIEDLEGKSNYDLEELESLDVDAINLSDLGATDDLEKIGAFSSSVPDRNDRSYSYEDPYDNEELVDSVRSYTSTSAPQSSIAKKVTTSYEPEPPLPANDTVDSEHNDKQIAMPYVPPVSQESGEVLTEGKSGLSDEEFSTIQTVIRWCNLIVTKDTITTEEQNAIEACKRVADCYA